MMSMARGRVLNELRWPHFTLPTPRKFRIQSRGKQPRSYATATTSKSLRLYSRFNREAASVVYGAGVIIPIAKELEWNFIQYKQLMTVGFIRAYIILDPIVVGPSPIDERRRGSPTTRRLFWKHLWSRNLCRKRANE